MNIKFHQGALEGGVRGGGGLHQSPRHSPPRHHAFIPPVRKNLHFRRGHIDFSEGQSSF